MRRLASIAFGLMHAACSGGAAAPDALMADASTGGLIIELVANGGVPQMPDTNVEILRVVLGVKSMRAIGDAAPGDLRTTRTDEPPQNIDLDWHDNLVPIPQLFPNAPPGVYSTIELRIADSNNSSAAITVEGRVVRGGNLVPFEIQNTTADVSIVIGISTVLAPRQLATTTIATDVAELVDDIDWDAVPLTPEGRLFIGDNDVGMASVVTNLKTAFAQRRN